MNKRVLALVLILLSSSIIVAGLLLGDLGKCDASDKKLYTYPLSDGDKTFIVNLETNWDAERAPKVFLFNSSTPDQYGIEIHFSGGYDKNVTCNITFPNDLLSDDISLIRKYYLQDPSRYTLSNNSTHTSLQMTFNYSAYFSGSGYFIIKRAEAMD